MSLESKIESWNELSSAFKEAYDEVLEQYWGSLNSFYEFFGVDDFGQAKVSDLGPNPTSE